MTNLHQAFKSLKDPRIRRNRKHKLLDIIILSILAVLCGAESYDSIALFGKENFLFLKQFLELKKGIPSHDTINRVFQMLNPRQFELCFISWAKGLKETGIMKDVIAMVSEPAELLTEKPFVVLKTVFIINLPCTLYMRGALKTAFVWGKWNVAKKPTK